MWEISFSQLGRGVGSQDSLKNRKLIEEGADSDYFTLKEIVLGKYGNRGVKHATRRPPKESVGATW